MIKEINIKNFALIDNVSVNLKEGFNIIMGETGSGKSNIIDAISIVFGQRAQKDKIRKSYDYAQISISLDASSSEDLINYLKDQDLYIEDELLVITRTIYTKSPTSSKVNDISVTSKVLKNIGSYVIDIYGQFENILILSKKEQLNFLDKLGDRKFLALLDQYKDLYKSYINSKNAYYDYLQSPEEMSRNTEFLQYQIKEIEDSDILNIDEDQVFKDLDIIENAQLIRDKTNLILNLLDDDDQGVLSSLEKVESSFEEILDYNKEAENLKNRVNSSLIELEDVKYEVYNILDNLDFDDDEYSTLNRSRDIIFEMRRKYGQTKEEIINLYESSLNELDSIINYENNLESLKNNMDRDYNRAEALAKEISTNRKLNADVLEKRLIKELNTLDMVDSSFKIDFKESKLGPDGLDEIRFLVSFNKNEELKDLSKVASGGEISRFMLAIKSIEANIDKKPVLIFDEIDTGISGNAGNVVGKKLKDLSKGRILMAVSHLPQIISMADHQYLVSKTSSGSRTSSTLKELSYEDRITELAKVIQGDDYSQSTLESAKNMIDKNRS